MKCFLEINIANPTDEKYCTCDGCGHKFVVGDKMITGIESCCGGCTRTICEQCVRHAVQLIEERP